MMWAQVKWFPSPNGTFSHWTRLPVVAPLHLTWSRLASVGNELVSVSQSWLSSNNAYSGLYPFFCESNEVVCITGCTQSHTGKMSTRMYKNLTGSGISDDLPRGVCGFVSREGSG